MNKSKRVHLCIFSEECVSVCDRDLRRSGSSPGKAEGERSPVGQPKSLTDVKLERTHQDGEERHSAAERPHPLGESLSCSQSDFVVAVFP